jgi:hypothetical protein
LWTAKLEALDFPPTYLGIAKIHAKKALRIQIRYCNGDWFGKASHVIVRGLARRRLVLAIYSYFHLARTRVKRVIIRNDFSNTVTPNLLGSEWRLVYLCLSMELVQRVIGRELGAIEKIANTKVNSKSVRYRWTANIISRFEA